MEREYTVGGLLILITVFVIALVVYYTVPEFNESVMRIADDVFGISVKQAEAAREYEEKEEAINLLKSLAQAYEETYKGNVGCTYDIEPGYFSEKYKIRLEELEDEKGKSTKVLTLYEQQFIIERRTLPEITSCVMAKSDDKEDIYFADIKYDGGIKISYKGREDSFLENAPKFYKFDEKSVCLITDNAKRFKDFFNSKKDCKTGVLEQEKKAIGKFQDFITLYKKCKEHDGTRECVCGEIDLDEIPTPHYLQVSQKNTETTFFLEKTSLKEVINNNIVIKKIDNWGDKIYTEEKERVTERNMVVYMGNKRDIYLSEPGDVAGGWFSKELPLCFEVNDYLKFNSAISKEKYKEKLLTFAPKAGPYFEDIYSAAKNYNVDFFLITSLVQQESNWDPKAVSWVGAGGLMQLMPGTAKDLGLKVPNYKTVKIEIKGKIREVSSCRKNFEKNCNYQKDERFNPEKNINAGVKYIKQIITELDKANNVEPIFENILASYNAGPGAVKKYGGFSNLPKTPGYDETRDYVKKICSSYAQLNAKVCYV